MFKRPWFFVVASAALAGPLIAEPLDVVLTVRAPLGIEPIPVVLHATPIVVSSADERPPAIIETSASAPGRSRLELVAKTSYRLEVLAPEHWVEPVTVTAGTSTEAHLELLATGLVRGRLESDEPLPTEVGLRFIASEHRASDFDGLRGKISCPVRDDAWSCRVPWGTYDLRVRASGFVSRYFWDRSVATDPLDLGTQTLIRGSSLVGWIETEDETAVEASKIELIPSTSGPPVTSRSLRVEALPGKEGFFHFEGVAPGAYGLQVSLKGYVTGVLDDVRILPGMEAALEERIVLKRPHPVTFTVSPPADVFGKSWKLELQPTRPGSSGFSGWTDDAGRWAEAGLPPGEYHLMITASDGSRVASEDVSIAPETDEHLVTLETIWVEGRVLLGDEPLPATVIFGGTHGSEAIRMEADEEGEFTGVLPRGGDWSADVRAKEPRIFRRLRGIEVDARGGGPAYVEIVLPETLIEAEVVDETDTPLAGAMVLIMRYPATEKPSFERTDSDGVFSLIGLDYGEYRLEAQHFGSDRQLSRSDPAVLEISKEAPSASARLVVHRTAKLTGRVVSAAGTAVVGASIMAELPIGATTPAMSVPSAETDPNGFFELHLPAGTQGLRVFIMAPGFTFAVVDLDAGRTETVIPLSQGGGGTLVLGLLPYPTVLFTDGQPHARVLYDQRLNFDLGLLMNWARMNGGSVPTSGSIQIQDLPPGGYQACWTVESKHEKSEVCEEGFLGPSGTLELTHKTRNPGGGSQ